MSFTVNKKSFSELTQAAKQSREDDFFDRGGEFVRDWLKIRTYWREWLDNLPGVLGWLFNPVTQAEGDNEKQLKLVKGLYETCIAVYNQKKRASNSLAK